MSPEQVHGKETDARSDLFSVGVILYEMATGVRPFEAKSLAGVLNAVTEREPTPLLQVNPHVGELFAHVVDRLLEKRPQKRFQTAAGVVAELESLGQPTHATVARNKAVWLGSTLAALLTLALTGGFYQPGWFLSDSEAADTPPTDSALRNPGVSPAPHLAARASGALARIARGGETQAGPRACWVPWGR